MQIGAEETGAAQGVGSKEFRLETKRANNSTKKRNKSRRTSVASRFSMLFMTSPISNNSTSRVKASSFWALHLF